MILCVAAAALATLGNLGRKARPGGGDNTLCAWPAFFDHGNTSAPACGDNGQALAPAYLINGKNIVKATKVRRRRRAGVKRRIYDAIEWR